MRGRQRIRAVEDINSAVELFRELGYLSPAYAFDAAELPHVERAMVARSEKVRRRGYGLCFAETQEPPRSFRPLARALRDKVHDRPLGVLGVIDGAGRWRRMVVLRPRTTSGGGGISVTKLEVDLASPTRHDGDVLNRLAWDATASSQQAQRRVDDAFDVEKVTNAFFRGLADHYQALISAVQAAIDSDPAVANQLKRLEGDPAERAALRILTQILFVQFLQRQGHVEGRRDWLSRAYRSRAGPFYQTVLERLFYASLGTPRDQRRAGDPDVPYLNGGLFDRFYGAISLPLPDDVFDTHEGLLGYLDQWTFTVTEEMPDEAHVAVDPEMLGKVFEHLVGEESIRARGTVYTPRPVVHFMCREALVPWLQTAAQLTEDQARILLTDPDPFGPKALGGELATERIRQVALAVPRALDDLAVLDPAVGSGAFLLGILSEVVRLRSACFAVLNQGSEPPPDQINAWKLDAIKRSLHGVDIEPRAIELCRLRLWLSLLVDLPNQTRPQPLPNLEFRTVTADSLVDFVGRVEVQNTRGGLDYFYEPGLTDLHERWFHAVGDEREKLLAEIRAAEHEVVSRQLAQARSQATTEEERARIDELAERFASADRQFPCFMPTLHAPEMAARGGWDVIIMNPPYVGSKEVPKRLNKTKVVDLKLHYGDTNDLMILFAERALQLVRAGGIVSMIFNDSITTSSDGDEIRRRWTDRNELLSLARTRCFEGKAITGGVVVVRATASTQRPGIRWIEGHGRPVGDFTEASDPRRFAATAGGMETAGELEVWDCPRHQYSRLPNRPLFRPSLPALIALDRFEQCKTWRDEWSRWDRKSRRGWKALSNTRQLEKMVAVLRERGFFERLAPIGFCSDWSSREASASKRVMIVGLSRRSRGPTRPRSTWRSRRSSKRRFSSTPRPTAYIGK